MIASMSDTVKIPTLARAERASRTRRRILEMARDRFLDQGYAATTMQQIAADAGVAVQTVYYTFRTKAQLLRELVEWTAAGADEQVGTVTPVADRAWAREMLTSDSPQRILALAVDHGTAIYDRVALLWPAIAAATGSDPAVADYWREVNASRRANQAAMVSRIAELGALRPGLERDRAADLVAFLAGHDPYRSLVVEAGWSVRSYRAWLYTILEDQLLATLPRDSRALRGISFRAALNR
jgi:AcrR family transcriptional regulator